MREVRATYRVQLRPDFGFADVVAIIPYLRDLGISHVYTSPLFEAEPASTHGYDVVDHHVVRAELGGPDGLRALWRELSNAGMGQIVDIVPNHLSIAGGHNPWFNDVVAHGEASRYSRYFDIDWNPPDPESRHKVVLPFLGDDGDTSTWPWPQSPYARPVSWRQAPRLLNYRRFFDISGLAALRVEDEVVFDDVHLLLRDWLDDPLAASVIDGVRVDHVDGLTDPQNYLERLRRLVGDRWMVVEKILATGEDLPGSWPVDGTTGYEFAAHTTRVFIGHDAEAELTDIAHDLGGLDVGWPQSVCEAKHRLTAGDLRPEVDRLVRAWSAQADALSDHDTRSVTAALVDQACALGVYRPYPPVPVVGPDGTAVRDPGVQARFAQLTAPLAAKAVEDTACYSWVRLLALNEVGGDPGRFGERPDEFHTAMTTTAASHPSTMLSLTTHDTKRGADVRARIGLLSEIPQRWRAAVGEWTSNNARHRTRAGEIEAPDPSTEYLVYQTLVGTWPLDESRALTYIAKAIREAKVHTSWTSPQRSFEDAVAGFVSAILSDEAFTASMSEFVSQLVVAGQVTSLAQVTLLLTAPGVPDIYQGDELWNLVLVDPDNRRPVDFDMRRRLLDDAVTMDGTEAWGEAQVWGDYEGLAKVFTVNRLLGLRRRLPAVFGPDSPYEPLEVTGPDAARGLAFSRGGEVAVVVPRLALSMDPFRAVATVHLPPGGWSDVLTGVPVRGGAIDTRILFAGFPVAVLERASTDPSASR